LNLPKTQGKAKISAVPLIFILACLGLFAVYDFYSLGTFQQMKALLNGVTVSPTLANQTNANINLLLVLRTNSSVIASGQSILVNVSVFNLENLPNNDFKNAMG
jgi:hypothetical protein